MTWGSIAPLLWQRQWRGLIPIVRGQKQPACQGWQRWSHERQTALPQAPATCGVGAVANNGWIAIDIDSDDPDIVAALVDALPPTDWHRIGRPPRRLLLYSGSLSRNLRWPCGLPIECFSVAGQIVLYGLHPKTGKEYSWPLRQPIEVAPWALPPCDEPRLVSSIQRVAQRLGDRAGGAVSSSVSELLTAALGRAARALGPEASDLELYAHALANQAPGARHLFATRLTMRLLHQGAPYDLTIDMVRRAWMQAFSGSAEGAREWNQIARWIWRRAPRPS